MSRPAGPRDRARATVGRGLDQLVVRLAGRLGPALDRIGGEQRELAGRLEELTGRAAQLETIAQAGFWETSALRRQLFYLSAAELARRHAGESALSAGSDLTRFELRVCSQNGEDGVIAEILRRLGPGAQEFVEFGAGTGVEGNCVALADLLGWRGLFIEADEPQAQALDRKYRGSERVRTMHAAVTAENIDELLEQGGVSAEPDVLSVDIDGNDLWVWRAITRARPRLVVIEYNAHLDHRRPLAVPYDPGWVWDGTDWFGASLAALELVGAEKGYRLVHTDLTGVNAFFVRHDLAQRFDDVAQVPRRSPNYDGRGAGHPESGAPRYVEVGPR